MWNLHAKNKPPDAAEDEKELDRILGNVLDSTGRDDDALLVPGLAADTMRKFARIVRMIERLPPARAVWFFSNLVTPALRRLHQAAERTCNLREEPPLALVRAASEDEESQAIHEWLLSVVSRSLRTGSCVPGRETRIALAWAEKHMEDAIIDRYRSIAAIRARCGFCFRHAGVREWLLAGTEKGAYIACPGCGRPDRLVFERV